MTIINRIKDYVNRHPLIKTGASYSVWATIKSVCSTLVGLAVMRWLNPFELGMWNTVSIFLAYLPFFQLGIQSGLNTELPVFLGKNDTKAAEIRISNGYTYACIVSLVFVLIGTILGIVSLRKNGISEGLGIVTITIIAICNSFQLHFMARYRSAKSFDKLTRIYQLEIPIILLCTYLIYRFGYWGILTYYTLTNVWYTSLLYKYSPFKNITPHLQLPIIYKMGKMGIAMMVLVQLRSAAQTLPRWIILAKSSIEKLGLYTPATAIGGLINLLPGQFAQFFYPQMGFKYGQSGRASDMWPYVKRLLWLLPSVVLPISVIIYLLAPCLLETLFPKYQDSLWAMRIMCVTFVFSSPNGTTWVFDTLKAFKYSYLSSCVHFIGCFIVPYFCTVLFELDILTSVTIGLAINEFLCYIMNCFLLHFVLHLPQYNKQ